MSQSNHGLGMPYFGNLTVWPIHRPRIFIGPHWYVHIAGLLIFCLGLISFDISNFSPFSSLYKILILIFHILAILVFVLIGFSDPGLAVLEDQQLPYETDRFCQACMIVRQKKTVHCKQCDTCILQYDHHCPWTGKCIGRNNLQLFYLFLGGISGSLILGLVGTILSSL